MSTIDINNLKSLRKKSGLTQDDLAKLMEVSKSTITKWETGQRNIMTDDLMKLGRIFNVPINNLIGAPTIIAQTDLLSYLKNIGYTVVHNPNNEFQFRIESEDMNITTNDNEFKEVEDLIKEFIDFQLHKFAKRNK